MAFYIKLMLFPLTLLAIAFFIPNALIYFIFIAILAQCINFGVYAIANFGIRDLNNLNDTEFVNSKFLTSELGKKFIKGMGKKHTGILTKSILALTSSFAISVFIYLYFPLAITAYIILLTFKIVNLYMMIDYVGLVFNTYDRIGKISVQKG